MKRIFILFGALTMALGLQAQQNQHSNYVGVNLEGGLNTFKYSLQNGESNFGPGFGADLHYMHFFGKHFGLGFGVRYSYSTASALFNGADSVSGMNHQDNNNLISYTLITKYNDWREKQNLHVFSVPVELYWRADLSKRWAMLIGLGAQLDMALSGKYNVSDGSYSTEGYFPALGYTLTDLPEYGFSTYNADNKGDFNLKKVGVSLIADLGFNYSLCNNWGLYFGIYGGYGLLNMIDTTANTEPMLKVNSTDATQIDYIGALSSTQTKNLHLLSVGVKIGVNIGWDCGHDGSKNSKEGDDALVSYDNNNTDANNAYGNNTDEQDALSAEEAAAREARCNARRMNAPEMAQAMKDIENDLEAADEFAKTNNSAAAAEHVKNARAKAADAKQAHRKGQYCKAYDLFGEAYAEIAESYASVAEGYANKIGNEEARKAAEDANLYAEAARRDGLDCAMAASRNARINAEIARDSENGGAKTAAAYNDPNYADYLAGEALAMADDANSKPARTDAKDASGKAYRGKLAESYAASAKSFAKSAESYANQSNNAEAKKAAKEAKRLSEEATEAARMGDVAAAYRLARAAQQAAERARQLSTGKSDSLGSKSDNNKPNSSTADRAQLQQYLDQINATVLFDFGSTEPKYDNKTSIAIRALCAAMKADNRVRVLITGHTDNVGTAEGNMSFGKRRAEALKAIMVNQGAPAANISTTSKGQNEPVVANDSDEHRHQNRRAVITLL